MSQYGVTTSNSRLVWNTSEHTPCSETALQALNSGAKEAWAPSSGTGHDAAHSRMIADRAQDLLGIAFNLRPENVIYATDFLATVRDIAEVSSRSRWLALTTERLDVVNRLSAEAVLTVDLDGRLSLDEAAWDDAIGSDPAQVGVWLSSANAEIGTTQDLPAISALLRARGVLLVIDVTVEASRLAGPVLGSTQGNIVVCRTGAFGDPLNSTIVGFAPSRTSDGTVDDEDEDLYITRYGELQSAFLRTYREPGALYALSAAVAVQAAQDHAALERDAWFNAIGTLRTSLAAIPGSDVAGHDTYRAPHILTASFLYCPGELLMTMLAARGLDVSSGSACALGTTSPSHVLEACGRLTQGNVRLVLPLSATKFELDSQVPKVVDLIAGVVREAREMLGVSELT